MPVLARLPLYFLFYTNNFDSSYGGKFKFDLKIDRIETIEFVDDWCPSKRVDVNRLSQKTLIVDNGDCDVRADLKEIALILRKDSTRAYRLLIPRI